MTGADGSGDAGHGQAAAAAAIPRGNGPPDARAAIWALAGELERRHHIARMYARACLRGSPPIGGG